MHQLSRLLTPERMVAVTPDGPFRALGIRSHGKGTFNRIDALAAVEEFGKTVYRVEPNLFVVNIVFAWEGAAAITSEADAGCLVSQRFPTFRVNEQLLDIEYFAAELTVPNPFSSCSHWRPRAEQAGTRR